MKIDYEAKINEYGSSLPPIEKKVARDVFIQLLDSGYDYRWLYYSIVNLGNRDIVRNRALFFYKPFQEEVRQLIEEEEKKEEQERQRRERICAAIAEQIEKSKNQNIKIIRIKKNKKEKKTAAEVLAEIMDMEDDE